MLLHNKTCSDKKFQWQKKPPYLSDKRTCLLFHGCCFTVCRLLPLLAIQLLSNRGRCTRNPMTFRTPGAVGAIREKALLVQINTRCCGKGNCTFRKRLPKRVSSSLVTYPGDPARSRRSLGHTGTSGPGTRVRPGLQGRSVSPLRPSLALCFHGRTAAFCDFLGVDAAGNLLKSGTIRSRGKKDAMSVRSVPLAFLG